MTPFVALVPTTMVLAADFVTRSGDGSKAMDQKTIADLAKYLRVAEVCATCVLVLWAR